MNYKNLNTICCKIDFYNYRSIEKSAQISPEQNDILGVHKRERRDWSGQIHIGSEGWGGSYDRGSVSVGYNRGWDYHPRSLNFDGVNFDLSDVEVNSCFF